MNLESDIGPLSWVKDEIGLALGRAAELLQKYAGEQDAVLLAEARTQLHQAQGALAIVGLDGVTEFARGIERLFDALTHGEVSWSRALGDAAQEGLAALRQYLDELVAGRPNQPLRLLPVYRRLNEARGASETAAADLFFPDLTQRPPKREAGSTALDAQAQQVRFKAARLGFERGLAKWSRQDLSGLRDMRTSIAIIEALQDQPAARAFWWITLAWFDALAAGGIADGDATRRLCERIDAQVHKLLDGARAVAERLMRDVLYDVATAGASNEHIELVRAAYRLRELVPAETAAGDPRVSILREMREHLGAASDDWDQFCAGAAIALPRFHEESAQLVTLAQQLGHVNLARLVAALANSANLLRKNPLLHSEALAAEVATALLLTEAAINRFDTLDVDFAAQVDTLTGRLNTLQRGETLPPHDLPALQALAQRAGSRIALHQGGRDLRADLQQVEQTLDAYFRDSSNGAALSGAAGHLHNIAGIFEQLGQPRAVQVTRECVQSIGAFLAPGHERQPGEFEEVARKISALGFFVAQLQHGPADLDALLSPPPPLVAAPSIETELSQMARISRTLVGALSDAPPDDGVRESLRNELKQNLEGVRNNARLVADESIERQASVALNMLASQAPHERIEALLAPRATEDEADVAAASESARLAHASAEEVDSELLAIFVEEVLQVLDTVGVQLYRSMASPGNPEHLTVLRRCFHTLKGSSRMVGLKDFSEAALAVESTLGYHLQRGIPATPELLAMVDTAQHIVSDWIERLQRRASAPDTTPLLRQCKALKQQDQEADEAATLPIPDVIPATRRDTLNPNPPVVTGSEPVGTTKHDLLPLFLEECEDLIPAAAAGFRSWRGEGGEIDKNGAEALQRILHTLKGSARMAGEADIGEAIHEIETRVVETQARQAATPALIDELETGFDRIANRIDSLRTVPEAGAAAPQLGLRVRAELVDTMVNESGEIAIARSRIEGVMKSLRASLGDLSENVSRLRAHLRELEIQAESRIESKTQLQNARAQDQEFDPLEMDRFTRLQELTRILAESVNDVATVEHSLMRDLDQADAALMQQARLSRELTQRLMGVRMVPFGSIAERLQRVVRMTSEETGKKVAFSIEGGKTELDRSVLERVTGPIEHLLRNAIVHGVETASQRVAAGKPAQGEVRLALSQVGNEVMISVSDDGGGLDYPRIRDEAVRRGLLAADQTASETQLAQLIYQAGFTTVNRLSEIAGRGVGLDVVRNETTALGGHVEVMEQPGHGTAFALHLPLTLAVIPVVLVKSGTRSFAIPASMVVQASEMKAEAMMQLRVAAAVEWQGLHFTLHYLPHLLGDAAAQPLPQRRHWVIMLRGGVQHVALEVDALVGNEEVVIKNIGPQLARVPGIGGATVLGDGEVVLIINPVALLNAQLSNVSRGVSTPPVVQAEAALPPMVMVVDDSLTVRKVTGRLLDRAGYRVVTAKDGVDALEQLAEVMPAVMLVDIEMPRMDGFELVRRLRADTRFKLLPVIMITSRIADKHRNYALELGVNHYLGKPYDEEALLALIAGFVAK